MPKDSSIKHVLIIGSGPIIIGQACEFDYSGSQAAQSLREEGIEVSLINSNPATIMTDPSMAEHIYLLPMTMDSIEKILQEQNITHVLPTMGGQTALNLAIEADELGLWDKYDVKIIGVDIAAIEKTENRDLFRSFMIELDVPIATSKVANSYLEAKEAAQQIGFPLVIRPSFTMGGYGGGFVHKKEEFDESVKRGLEASPTHEVLVEQAVIGWKEYELELLRDSNDNIAVICTIENFDPMGIHTGESITVAPAMTLSDTCFQEMRNMAFRMMRNLGTFAGGCNVQFSVNPEDEQIIAIEINPRVSRSSALASKATGYPIANIAAKLALGYELSELKNPVTKTTSAFFEPSIDYTIVKIPRWDFNKFQGSERTLGLQMKSVGEVMSIGRSFQEALQKATQSLEIKRLGLGSDGYELKNLEQIIHSLENPSWDRVFHIRDAMALGVPITSIQKITKIDRWFLEQIYDLVKMDREIKKYTLDNIDSGVLRLAKEKGFADAQIAHLLGGDVTDMDVYNKRTSMGINRVYKMVDTCSAEFSSPTNYLYSTFDGQNESVVSDKKKIIVIGSGPNRIGQG
ncbi:MAG: carbamoyl-phosphate synthase large subunit, partial [Bacteroidia bacterium]